MSENTTILLRQEDRLEYGLRTVEWVAFSKIKAIIEYSRSLNNEPVYWGGSRYLSEIMPECKHTCAKILEQLVEKGALLKFYSVVGNDLQWSQIYYLARDYPEDKPHPLEGTIHEISSRPSPDKVANLAVMRKQGKWHMELGGIPKTDTPRIPKDATPSAQEACIPHVENCPGGVPQFEDPILISIETLCNQDKEDFINDSRVHEWFLSSMKGKGALNPDRELATFLSEVQQYKEIIPSKMAYKLKTWSPRDSMAVLYDAWIEATREMTKVLYEKCGAESYNDIFHIREKTKISRTLMDGKMCILVSSDNLLNLLKTHCSDTIMQSRPYLLLGADGINFVKLNELS